MTLSLNLIYNTRRNNSGKIILGIQLFSKFQGKGQFSLCVPPVECRSGIGICGRGSDYLGSSVTRDTRDPWEFTTSYSRQWRGWGTDAACTQLLQTTPTQSGDMVSCKGQQTQPSFQRASSESDLRKTLENTFRHKNFISFCPKISFVRFSINIIDES